MKSITKNKLKMIAMKEIVRSNPNLTVGEFNKIFNDRLKKYQNILERV